ncbi:MAG: hypothetical protein ACT4OF_06710, partial [Caulobacteraceae bacterium]
LMRFILLIGARSRSRRVRRWLNWLERWVECTIFLMAVRRFGYLPRRRKRRPANTPGGFRRVRGSRRLFYKSARIRAKGCARTRISRLLDVLADPARYIDRFFKRLCRGLRLTRLVAVAPPAALLASALAAPPAIADSS